MMLEQSTAMSLEHPAAAALPTVAAERDDPCARIHLYQQQLRAELLGAVAASDSRSSGFWHRQVAVRIGQWAAPAVVGQTVQAVEHALRGLTEALGHGVTGHAVSLGTGAR
jgi:hypothetical protein